MALRTDVFWRQCRRLILFSMMQSPGRAGAYHCTDLSAVDAMSAASGASMFKRFGRAAMTWALCLSIALPLLYMETVQAETQYIIDTLTVPLRRGPSNQHKIIHAGLPSGTSLEILGVDA